MIRFIAAIDAKNGIANETGIPWKGRLPTDVAYYRNKVKNHPYIIGFGTYVLHTKPLPDTPTYVATEKKEELREGFFKVTDARQFLENAKEDVWVGGGAKLYETTLDLADELYLTRIHQDFNCTKFFPNFEDTFVLIDKQPVQIENDIQFHFEVWRQLQKQR